jgi:hypothetical protein
MANKTLTEIEAQKLPETIKFIYTKSPDYKVIYSNGIYGGLTGNLELRFDLFQEFKQFPSEETREINEDGSVGRLISESQDSQQLEIIREKQIGVIMTITTAKALHKWLEEKLKIYAQIETKEVE